MITTALLSGLYKQMSHLSLRWAYFTGMNNNPLQIACLFPSWRKWQVKFKTVLNMTLQKKAKWWREKEHYVCFLPVHFFSGAITSVKSATASNGVSQKKSSCTLSLGLSWQPVTRMLRDLKDKVSFQPGFQVQPSYAVLYCHQRHWDLNPCTHTFWNRYW